MKKFLLYSTICFVTNISLYASFHEERSTPWGRDSDLLQCRENYNLREKSREHKVCQSLISFYQNYISPIDGPRSSFYPSSSQYARDAIAKYGVLQGIALGCDRLLRENRDEWIYERVAAYGGIRKYDPVR